MRLQVALADPSRERDVTHDLDCSGCPGACCDPVVLGFTKLEASRMELDARTRRWVLEDLTPMPGREARAKAPQLFTGRQMFQADGTPILFPMVYRCRHLDPDTKLCTNYADRPDQCRDFPRYGDPLVRPDAVLPATCVYRTDQGLTPEPVPVTLTTKPVKADS